MTSASLEIRQPSLWSSDAHLTPPGSSIPLYTVQTHRWSSRLTFFAPTPGSSEKTLPAAADPAFLGEATFRSFKSDMTLTLRGLTLTMRRQAVLSASYKFTSAAPGQQGAIFTWKRNRAMRTFDHVLEDPRGVAIARLFRDASCSWTRKMGTIGESLPVPWA